MHFYIKQKELLCQGFVWSQSSANKVAVIFVPHMMSVPWLWQMQTLVVPSSGALEE